MASTVGDSDNDPAAPGRRPLFGVTVRAETRPGADDDGAAVPTEPAGTEPADVEPAPFVELKGPPLPGKPRRSYRRLERVSYRTWLIHQLAAGASAGRCARDIGCSISAVHDFRRRHAEEIHAMRRKLADRQTESWIAEVAARVASMQDDVERLDGLLDTAAPGDVGELTRTKARLMHEIAEQLGQLPNRLSAAAPAPMVAYEITFTDGRGNTMPDNL